MLNLPAVKVAAVQASPVFLDTAATVEKACSLIHEAALNGAQIVAFPEVFVPAYPYWNWIMTPVQGSPWFEKLCLAAIEIPGPEIDRLARAARQNKMYVVIGVNERSRHGIGTIYNTLVFLGPDGELLGKHRKLVPTWAEKLTWASGDGSSLRVFDTSVGKLGGLACGENTNTLARFSLLAQGELLHVASYISLPIGPDSYDMADAIKVRSMAHSFEGKVFTVVSCSTVTEEIAALFEPTCPGISERFQRKHSAFSGVIGPDGRVIGEPLIDDEGIVYADVDFTRCIQPRQMHDIVGHYNRFDIFDLRVNRQTQQPARYYDGPSETRPGAFESVIDPDRGERLVDPDGRE
ncbi:MAG: carbon-nitrogen hydrolase family protein [Candidimonas sp.]|nr:MAG: carbon-nitrogen hydrolase family protein [Candidimonas sp.]